MASGLLRRNGNAALQAVQDYSVVSETLYIVRRLVSAGEVRISEHGYDELSQDGILVRDILSGISAAAVVEDYPDFVKGPAVLVLHFDAEGRPIHVVWGIPRGTNGPAVVVTADRPDPARWSEDFTRRRT